MQSRHRQNPRNSVRIHSGRHRNDRAPHPNRHRHNGPNPGRQQARLSFLFSLQKLKSLNLCDLKGTRSLSPSSTETDPPERIAPPRIRFPKRFPDPAPGW